jgi:hypothetical protein
MATKISGAGSEITAFAESLQAYACATRQFLGRDLTDISEITNKTTKDAVCDRTLDDSIKFLNEKWYHSVIVTANKIFEDVPGAKSGQKYEFYRGGNFVNQIYDNWRVFKKGSGLTQDDKWNPADIWMVRKGFKLKTKFDTLIEYNRYIFDEFANKNLIGISLKLVPKGQPTSKIFNDGKPPAAKFTGFKLGMNMFDSKDIYIQFTADGKDGEIQLRNFSSRPVVSSWQGEIKGKTAAGGKIGGGNVIQAALESGVLRTDITVPNTFNSQIQKPSEQTFKKFAMMFKELSGSRTKIDDLIRETKSAHKIDKTWWMSKYLSISFCYGIQKKKKEDQVTKWLFKYGSSASSNSSIFIKYS